LANAAASASAVSRFVAAKCAVYLNNVLLVVVAFYLFSLLGVLVSIDRRMACPEMWENDFTGHDSVISKNVIKTLQADESLGQGTALKCFPTIICEPNVIVGIGRPHSLEQ